MNTYTYIVCVFIHARIIVKQSIYRQYELWIENIFDIFHVMFFMFGGYYHFSSPFRIAGAATGSG